MRDELGMPRIGQCRRDVAQRVGEPEADHVTRGRLVGHRLAHVAQRLADRARDERRGVGERAVPVEDDELVASLVGAHASPSPSRNV